MSNILVSWFLQAKIQYNFFFLKLCQELYSPFFFFSPLHLLFCESIFIAVSFCYLFFWIQCSLLVFSSISSSSLLIFLPFPLHSFIFFSFSLQLQLSYRFFPSVIFYSFVFFLQFCLRHSSPKILITPFLLNDMSSASELLSFLQTRAVCFSISFQFVTSTHVFWIFLSKMIPFF